ncbi:MAG TPA: hypothetical protein VF188_15895 [Longimicrobiales bacterium]
MDPRRGDDGFARRREPRTGPLLVAFYVLLGLALLRIMVVLIGAALLIRPVSACPACFRECIAIRRPWLARLAPWCEWRWCPHCGWQGPARATDRGAE